MCAADYLWFVAAVEGLGSAVIVVILSLYVLCRHFVNSVETAAHSQCAWEMLSVWIYNHKAPDKMAFLCLCPLGTRKQLAAEGGLGRLGQCGIVDVLFQEH